MATPNEKAIKSLETIAKEGKENWKSVDLPANFGIRYADYSALKDSIKKNKIDCKIAQDYTGKLQIYVAPENYEKAIEIAKKGA